MIVEKLEYWTKKRPEKVALQIKGQSGYERVTYLELWNRCLYAASQLRGYGMEPGDHIALYAENSPSWVVSYLAIHMLGGIVVPLDSQLGGQDVLPFLSFSQSKAILVDEVHKEKLEPVLANFPAEMRLVSVESLCSGSEPVNGFKPYIKKPDDLMSIIFTSGTTGTPKGVQLTCRNIESNVEAVLSQIKVTPEDNILNILPLHHSFACTMGLLTPIFAGATVTFSHSLKSTDLLAIMRESGVTIFPGVPKLFTLLDREIFKKVDSLGLFPRTVFWTLYKVSKWFRETAGIRLGKLFFRKVHAPFGKRFRFFASGGAKLEPGVSERFLNLGLPILEGYGLTETSPVISITPPGNPKPGTVGRPIPGVEVRINSPNEEGTGEICVRGPNVMKGYYNNEGATGEVIRGGWFHTGDLGMIDSEGNIVITGRAKEVIVLPSGKNIYPEEVEKQYEGAIFVKEFCVLPSTANDGSVKGLRMVVVPDVKELTARSVFNPRERIRSEISSIGSRLPSYMQITELELFYGELPRTRLGKLRRNEIEKLIKQQKPSAGEEQLTLSEEENALMEAPHSERFLRRLQEIAGVSGPFHPDQDLSIDLGLDSLTLIQITVLLENEFGVRLKEEELSSVRTIGDVLKRIQDASSGHSYEEKDHSMKNLLAEHPGVPLEEFFNINRGIVKRAGIRIARSFASLIMRVAFRVRVKGLHKIPKQGPILICPNHQSYIDPILIFALVPGPVLDRLVFVGFGEIFRRPPLSWVSRPARLIPTGSAGTLGESLKLSYECLKRGMAVCIFPEGGRTTTGKIMPPRLGTGILSIEAQAPVVPILIEGAINTLSRVRPEFKLPKVQVIIGDPIYPPDGDNSGELYQEVVDRWKESVLELENRATEAYRRSVVKD